MTGSSVSSRALADTNVVVYAHDPADAAKHFLARQLIDSLLLSQRLVLSVQTLNEFYAVSTRPTRPTPLSHNEAVTILEDLAQASVVVPLTEAITFRALEAVPLHGLSFWDALIWAAAKASGATILYSEDFQHDRVIDGIRFQNPFLLAP